jgi:hypothetical protein
MSPFESHFMQAFAFSDSSSGIYQNGSLMGLNGGLSD